MTNALAGAWRCTVCGYVHQGTDAPDVCPVCGAGKSDFEPYTARAESAVPAAANRWQCLVCNYVHEGAEAPEQCPICGAGRDQFQPVPEAAHGTGGSPVRVVIIGGGVAGVSAAETVRANSPESKIVLVATEGELPYYRLNLTRYLAGEIRRDTLPIHPEGWYAEQDIELLRAATVERLDLAEHKVVLPGGRVLAYERLILAMGSHPYVPTLDGVNLPGVNTLRTAADADAILDAVRAGRPVVCIGGGVLGIETAGALARQGADVTMLESHAWLMPRQLNPAGAALLERHMVGIGVKILKNARTAAIEGAGRVEAVRLQDGRRIPAGLVILATGVRPNTALARKAGIDVNTGILVDNHLRTSAADVFAAGDAAEHNGQVYGSWAASQYQGSIAALNALGIATAFGGLPRASTIKALGLDISSVGKIAPEDGSYVVVEESTERTYRQFLFHDGKLVGAILVGDTRALSAAKAAIEGGRDASTRLQQAPDAAQVLEWLGAND